MSYVPTPPELPGIVGLFAFRPQTAHPLNLLAETLLRGESPLSRGERELIASFVSSLNCTSFCQYSHGAAAVAHLGDRARLEALWTEGPQAEPDPKMRALLVVAQAVATSPQGVTPAMVEAARAEGADDVTLHDTVLIASAFCMFNRYVDGLATVGPKDFDAYAGMGQMLATEGYMRVRPGVPTV